MTELTDNSSAANLSQETALLEFSNAILQRVLNAAPLLDVLTFIACGIEAVESEVSCSILLLEESGQHLQHGVAPTLPEAYCAAIDGVEIGPMVGSCGTAVYRCEPVFVGDIATDPLWANFKGLALGHGLAACWSSPIKSTRGKVLGTFAVYWPTPQIEASGLACRYVETATRLAGIAIESARREAVLQGQLEELRRWQQLTLGREGRVLSLKREVNSLLLRLGELPRYGSVSGNEDSA
jgi:GAF domain-containing protein